jgi:hypothetical protein
MPDILALVDGDGQLLCACGCGAPITDQSPSAYFASEACSARWHNGTAPPPTATRSRSQEFVAVAVVHRTPHEAEPNDLRSSPAAMWLHSVNNRFVTDARLWISGNGDLMVEIPRQPGPMFYTRQCSRCRRVDAPRTVSKPVPPEQYVPAADLIQSCPACDGRHEGAFLTFVTALHPMEGIRLDMTDGRFRATAVVPPIAGTWDGDVAAVLAGHAWNRLERLIGDFASRWPVTDPDQPSQLNTSEPYTFTVPPPRRSTQMPPWRRST